MIAGGSMLARLGLAVVLGAASAAASHAQPPREGFWNVQGRAIPGMSCGDWMVRLAVKQGRLTGWLAWDRAM